MPDTTRHPLALGATLVVITAAIVVALATSEPSGTGATNVGSSSAGAPPEAGAATDLDGKTGQPASRSRRCKATESNPGGDNNYIPDAPEAGSLGTGLVITGRVLSAPGCEPLDDVPIQIWLATETGGEQDNRATVRTNASGRYRIETAPTVPQFGEPNIHVAYEGEDYRKVFIRRVVDLEDDRAVVDLNLTDDRG